MGVADRRLLGGGVGESAEELLRALARGASEHGVDETVARATPALGELDGVGDDRVVGRATQVEQLVQAEPERGQHGRVEALHRAPGELLDQVIERGLALDRAEGQAHRQRAVAWIEIARLGLQRVIGVGALLEDAAQHGERAAARGRDGGTRWWGHRCHDRYPLRCAPAGRHASARSRARRSASEGSSVAVVTRTAGGLSASR